LENPGPVSVGLAQGTPAGAKSSMHKLFAVLRETLSIGNDLTGVLAFCGITIASMYGIVVAVVGVLTNIRWFWVLILTPVAGALLVVPITVILMHRRPRPDVNVADWVGHPVYTVWIAACLWNNQKPWPYIPVDSSAYPALQKIKGAIQSGQIKMVSGNGNMQSRVTRLELLKLAKLYNERPEFLFPNQKKK
jgi:hypothetical protein